MAEGEAAPAPFGSVLGVAPGGVPAYSSDYDTADERELPNRRAFRNYTGDVYLGYKWQCVEFARRWLFHNHGYVFDDVAMAYEIFRLRSVRRVATGETLPLRAFRNGCRRPPEPGCLLVWDEGGTFEHTGHVAVVVEVLPDRVRIAEQNFDHRPWPAGQPFAREIAARTTEDGACWLRCGFGEARILGWVVQTGDDSDAETFAPPDPRLFAVQGGHAAARDAAGSSWLNVANPDEAAYVAMMGGHKLAARPDCERRFLVISETALEELERATNELHALFMHATDFVLRDDSLLSKFNLPEAVWPRIQQSWDNRRNQMITGRFDFSLSERGLKVYEYNCDSASCHMDAGKVQGRWAEHYRCAVGRDPGALLQKELVDAWRDSDVARRRAAGEVVDGDGVPIAWVWKTWAWETALDQLRAEFEGEDRVVLPGDHRQRDRPRLVDVLLRPRVMVYEPLWTLIPSNKAILPVLWELYPHHPYLLEAAFELTDTLRASGYVQKPIVGRCGANISIFSSDQSVIETTSGSFDDRDTIFQQLFALPRVGTDHVQVCTFSAAGTYAGSCVRIDPSPVITAASDIVALRVLDDVAFLGGDWAGRDAPDGYQI